MGTKYSSNSSSGYNSTPPSDDGTVAESNKVKWSTIKTKLTDPVKTLADTINSELATHFDNGPVVYTSSQTLAATHYNQIVQVSGSGVTLTLSDAASLTAGWFCDIVSTDASNNVTLARATASNTINETSADVTILPLSELRVIVNAAATGFLVSEGARKGKTHTIGEVTKHNALVIWARGAAIGDANISSGVLTCGTDGNSFDFSGTAAVTEIATLGVGTRIRLVHTSARTLTHHATNLILPGGANITTASGDVSDWEEYASGDWRCTNYTKANGTPIAISVVEADIASSSVSQTKLKSTTGEVSSTAGPDLQVLPGGEYGFYPQLKDNGSSSNVSAQIAGSYDTTTSYVTTILLNATYGGGTVFAQQRYIQASPPYNLGDGDIPLFVFVLVNSQGNVVSSYVAPEAPWHNNGPTDIRADYYTSDGRGYRKIKEFFAEHGSIKEALSRGLTRQQIANLIRDSKMVDVEITQKIKNADMRLLPHPFLKIPASHTVVLLDPVSSLMESLLYLHESGESVGELLHDGNLIVSNNEVTRSCPRGVMACTAIWKDH